ncbi:MAG: iron chaperone, partial [Fimbriimonadaceae bacterium]
SLSKLRATIREVVPQADECISYGIPTYNCKGFIASFAAFKNHCSLFPGHTVADFSDRLKGYKTGKGTIQFPHDKPLPEELVREIVKTRMAENLAGAS